MGLNACHHGDYGGNLPPAAPTFTYHDPRTGHGKRLNARYMAIDTLAGTEHSFPRDERQIRQYRAGFTAHVEIDRAVLGLEVVRVWTSIGRHRCEVQFSDGITVKITQAQLRALLNKWRPVRLMIIPRQAAPRVKKNYATLDDCVMVFGKIFRPDDPKLKELLERQVAINARQAAKRNHLQDVIELPAHSQSTIDNARAAFAAQVAALDICPLETARMNAILEQARKGSQNYRSLPQNQPNLKNKRKTRETLKPAPKRSNTPRIASSGLRVRKYAA